MTAKPDPWWTDVEFNLSAMLQTLDQHDEPLIAAHVAMALECLQARAYDLKGGRF